MISQIKFNIAAINCCTEAEGPFKRAAIWFQGCDKHCPECCNPLYFSFEPAHILTLEYLMQIIKDSKTKYGIEGVTYLGGEPVLQTGIKYLSSEIKKINLGILLFTGRLYSELDDDIINSADLIIDGGFEKNNLEDKRNLIGSRNQKMFFVTDRYKRYEDWFFIPRPKEAEINVSGCLTINGDYLINPVLAKKWNNTF